MPLDYMVRAEVPRALFSRQDALLVRARATRVLRELGHQKELVSLVLTGDEEIHALNRDYRQKNKPTDVLAFAMSEGEFAEHRGAMLGDVIVSVETAARQAQRAKKTVLDEVSMLVVHGILHLLGWDHDTKPKERRMFAETDRLLGIAASAKAPARKKQVKKARNLAKKA